VTGKNLNLQKISENLYDPRDLRSISYAGAADLPP
jgi:hypothetical protein